MVLTAVVNTPLLHSLSVILLCGLSVSGLDVCLVTQPIYIAGELIANVSLIWQHWR